MTMSASRLDQAHGAPEAPLRSSVASSPRSRTSNAAAHLRGLDALFAPRSVAVVGASERAGSLGQTVFKNLIDSRFAGNLIPVNQKHGIVSGRQAVASLRELNEVPDLVVVAIPARNVEPVITDCCAIGVPAAIILSAGFEQLGPESDAIKRRILQSARDAGLRIIGPNCLGIIRPSAHLNASFAAADAKPGRLAFLSQSGALCTAVLDWSRREGIGFSAFASVGSMLDVGWGELFDYFGNDPQTSCILAYLESVGDARSFLAAARTAALAKPIIVLKGGRTDAAAKAATSHTGALAGSDLVFDAAMQRVGVLRVDQLADLFHVAEVMSKQPRPRGRRLTILTNAGGPGVLATDALIRGGGQLAALPADLVAQLDKILPACWSRENPIDIIGDADPARFTSAVQIAVQNPDSDALLTILTPQAMTEPLESARQLTPVLQATKKAVLTCWMGGDSVQAANDELNAAGIPTFAYPDTAARVFNHLWRYGEQLQNLYETPSGSTDPLHAKGRQRHVASLLEQIGQSGRTLLTEEESKRVLHSYGIPTVPTCVAKAADDAVAAARRFGYPVVLKLHSQAQTHKSDLGGVELDLQSDDAVRRAFDRISSAMQTRGLAADFLGVSVQPMELRKGVELILGSSYDPQFGPCVLFGSGGTLVEITRDQAIEIPPLNSTLARRLIDKTKISAALKGFRQRPPADLPQLERTLVAFSDLIVEQPRIRECDINPLFATSDGIVALDARIVLHPSQTPNGVAPPAIRPYPLQYARAVTLKDGTSAILRPIRLEDESAMAAFHNSLSEESIYQRYFGVASLAHRTDHARLIRICLNDFDCQMALVAVKAGSGEILGVGRLSRARGSKTAEFALLVADRWQHRGVGGALLDQLIEIGRNEGLERIVGSTLRNNLAMAGLCSERGFEALDDACDDVIRLERTIGRPKRCCDSMPREKIVQRQHDLDRD